jgi:hypothetical protein
MASTPISSTVGRRHATRTHPQNIDGHFIEGSDAYFSAAAVDHAFVDGMPELVARKRKHKYVNGVDPALRHDSTWALVLDVTDPDHAVGVKAVRARGKQQVDDVVQLVMDNTTPTTAKRVGAAPPSTRRVSAARCSRTH